MRRKVLVGMVVIFLITLLFIPTVYKNGESKTLLSSYNEDSSFVVYDLPPNEESDGFQSQMVEVEIHECFGGGADHSYLKEIPWDKVVELKEKLNDERDPEKQLFILKEYGLIQEDVTWECIQNYHGENLMGGKNADIPNNLSRFIAKEANVMINVNCIISCIGVAITFPPIIPSIILLDTLLVIPFFGFLYAMKWMFATTIAFILTFPIISGDFPNIGFLLGNTLFTVPFGLIWGLGAILTTNGSMGVWSWSGQHLSILSGFIGFWFNFGVFEFILGKALFIATIGY